jgi:class 3 adenylate cyclase
VLLCTSCGRESAEDFAFCPHCGAPLAEPKGTREQRKVVTVLFCDVTGSTEMGEKLDPEALRALLARYFNRMKAIVERHGGSVEKFIGDAVMAVFGVPVVHEDDALRALRAAVEMREAFPELDVQGRIGVTTGEVVTGTDERLATGDAVNVAARLEQAARPGEILIGEETFQLARDAAEVEALEPLALKGKAETVQVYRLRSVQGVEGVRPPPGRAHGGARARAALARGRLGPSRLGALVPPVHDPRVGRGRKVTPGSRVPRLARGGARRSRPLPALRRGHHLLARRRGGQAAPGD